MNTELLQNIFSSEAEAWFYVGIEEDSIAWDGWVSQEEMLEALMHMYETADLELKPAFVTFALHVLQRTDN